jgi:23S rRNA (cytosine1962-C5)-methyltransferase
MTPHLLIPSPLIPPPSERRIALHVSPAAERAIRSGHSWLFAEAIRHQSFMGKPGDLAVVFDQKRRFLAVGLYDPYSPIRVRILQAGKAATIDAAWFEEKLATAVTLRQPISHTNTTGYRLVHGENDGLPGLVIDRYDKTLVLKLYTAAWLPHLQNVLAGLTAITQFQRILLRLSRFAQRYPEHLYGLENGYLLAGEPLKGPVTFLENGLTFEVDVVNGQKTGFFLDQRDNRARVEKLAGGKRVLNVFAYTGGFSLYAARGGAAQVMSVDLSQPALAAAMRNFKLNRANPQVAACDHEILVGDAFRALKQIRDSRRKFDVVVIDPPAFAKKQEEVERALTAYGRLTRLGLGVLNPGGTLVIASCSSRVGADLFFETVHQAAAKVGRPLQEIERTAHPLDHPITFSEGAYLKCLFAVAG